MRKIKKKQKMPNKNQQNNKIKKIQKLSPVF